MEITSHKFYFVVSAEGKEWARELQPISARRAKECKGCGSRGGLFFRDCGPEWLVGERLTVRHDNQTDTRCWSCWMVHDEPAFFINKHDQTIRNSFRATIMFAKDKTELVWLVKRWKNGQKLMREVRTPHGDAVVFAKEDDTLGDDYLLKCPHCQKSIVVTAAAH